MADSLMYQENHFVVLETNQPEQFLTAQEMLEKLRSLLAQRQTDLPPDLQKFSTITEQAQYLLDTTCTLEMEAGQYLEWYAVRLEK
ncbi:MAG: chlororespiratory reduction protein 7 [Leptolyngbyaceae cyanobacterium CSU_1_3]|nr:chlororespiratory reduction protein 7 [Leptolyngbyaceae cyanobacterium CSU_1_3]